MPPEDLQMTSSFHALLETLLKHPTFQTLHQLLKDLDDAKLEALLTELFMKLSDTKFYVRCGEWLLKEAKEHPLEVALILIAGVLIMNPLGLIGFGKLGPVSGSLAAAWQSSIGAVEAGSLFAFLQGLAMAPPVKAMIPAIGWILGVGVAVKELSKI